MRIFVDTSAWYAYFDQDDNYHQRAVSFFEKRYSLVTSGLVLSETLALLQRRVGKKISARTGDFLLNSTLVEIVSLGRGLLDQTFSLFKGSPAKVSFVDCSNKVVMDNLGIKEIFCFDKDFKKLGLKVLP